MFTPRHRAASHPSDSRATQRNQPHLTAFPRSSPFPRPQAEGGWWLRRTLACAALFVHGARMGAMALAHFRREGYGFCNWRLREDLVGRN